MPPDFRYLRNLPARTARVGAAVAITTTAGAIATAVKAAGASAAWATARFAVFFHGLFGSPTFQHGLAGEADFAHVIDGDHHHGDLVADLNNVFHLFDPLGIELGDVYHTVDVWQNFHESTKVGHAHHLAGVDLSLIH